MLFLMVCGLSDQREGPYGPNIQLPHKFVDQYIF